MMTRLALPALAALSLTLIQPAPAHAEMSHDQHMAQIASGVGITEPGQAAFGAIAQIVAALNADPATDWSRVDIPALRAHLIDMDLLTMHAVVSTVESADGAVFTVTGPADVAAAIRRMTHAHSTMMQGEWGYDVADIDGGVTMSVTVPSQDRAKLHGLGFIGVMADGMHHQMHHWMMATGADPH